MTNDDDNDDNELFFSDYNSIYTPNFKGHDGKYFLPHVLLLYQ